MIMAALTLHFITYDGQPGSRPPIYEWGAINKPEVPLPHELDGHHYEVLVIPEGQDRPLSMAFALYYLGPGNGFEWVSCFRAADKEDDDCAGRLADISGNDVILDEAGYIVFPLKIGDRWALWPSITSLRSEILKCH